MITKKAVQMTTTVKAEIQLRVRLVRKEMTTTDRKGDTKEIRN